MTKKIVNIGSKMKRIVNTGPKQPYLDPAQIATALGADRVDGATRLSRLNAGQLASWLKDYSLGQLWEKNELGGRPAPE